MQFIQKDSLHLPMESVCANSTISWDIASSLCLNATSFADALVNPVDTLMKDAPVAIGVSVNYKLSRRRNAVPGAKRPSSLGDATCKMAILSASLTTNDDE